MVEIDWAKVRRYAKVGDDILDTKWSGMVEQRSMLTMGS